MGQKDWATLQLLFSEILSCLKNKLFQTSLSQWTGLYGVARSEKVPFLRVIMNAM